MNGPVDLYKITTPDLQRAVGDGDLHSVTAALINCADPNALAAYGDPMLVVASSRGHLKIVEILLEYGADPNMSTQNGSALLQTVTCGHPCIADALISAGATFSWRHADQAALYNRVSLLNLFLAGGVPVNQVNGNGDTLLMSAAYGGHVHAVQTLLDAGANVNASNDNGWTALLAATSNGKDDVVKLLLQAGADPRAADKSGDTPLKMVTQEGHTKIAALLKEAGANK